MVLHYGLVELPQSGYQSPLADDRVGYFLSAVKGFQHRQQGHHLLRHVNRWRLERAETHGIGGLAPPKKKITRLIQKSRARRIPRAYAREGILEWNKAFEKIGTRGRGGGGE